MPGGHNFEVLASRTVVEEVLSSREVQAARCRIPGVFDPCPDAGSFGQRVKGRLEVGSNGSRRRRPVLAPPGSGGFNLPRGPGLDADGESQV